MSEEQQVPEEESYDPADHSAAEVKDELADADQEERDRIAGLEQAGKNRSTVLEAAGVEPGERLDASGRRLFPWEVIPTKNELV